MLTQARPTVTRETRDYNLTIYHVSVGNTTFHIRPYVPLFDQEDLKHSWFALLVDDKWICRVSDWNDICLLSGRRPSKVDFAVPQSFHKANPDSPNNMGYAWSYEEQDAVSSSATFGNPVAKDTLHKQARRNLAQAIYDSSK